MTEKELVERYLGIPYKHNGRDLSGLDCWGLIIDAFRSDKGIILLDLCAYDEKGCVIGGNEAIENHYKCYSEHGAPVFFDVLLFRNKDGNIFHAALYLSRSRFLHAHKRAGVVIDRLDKKVWSERLAGIYRYKEIK
jgi:cell wall-associated NlpC family hydrolase